MNSLLKLFSWSIIIITCIILSPVALLFLIPIFVGFVVMWAFIEANFYGILIYLLGLSMAMLTFCGELFLLHWSIMWLIQN